MTKGFLNPHKNTHSICFSIFSQLHMEAKWEALKKIISQEWKIVSSDMELIATGDGVMLLSKLSMDVVSVTFGPDWDRVKKIN